MREKIEPGGGDKPDVEIIDPNDPEEKSKKNKLERTPTVRIKLHDSGNKKMWMPEGDKMSIQDLDLIINEIIEKAKYWGGGFIMKGSSGGDMKVTRKPVIWGTDEKPSEREARLARMTAHNQRIKQKIARAVAKKKVVPFPKPAKISTTIQPMRKAVNAGLELRKDLEDIFSEYRTSHRSTAREREAHESRRKASLERIKARQKELRKQRVLASIGR